MHGSHPAQGFHFPPSAEGDGQYGYAPQGNGQLPPSYQQPPADQQWGQQPDPRGYDLGNYMPTAGQDYTANPGHFPQPVEHVPYGSGQHGYGESDADYDEIYADEEDEPRRGRRALLIGVALAAAIGLGGGLAYAYKVLFAPGGGRAPLVRAADFGSNKVRPDNPGGKEFAHTDKKLLNRLGDAAAPPSAAENAAESSDEANRPGASEDSAGPRKVRIIPITPGGSSPQTAAAAAAPPPAAAGAVVSVPGLTIDSGGAPRAYPAPQPPPAQASAPPPVKAVAPPPVRVAAATTAPAPPPAEPAPPKKAAAPAAVPPAAAPTKSAPARREASAAVATTASSGFVAVLSSQRSRMDALRAFADLQQKYGDVLGTRTPDVQEANLGEKGVWYRAVVGPPASRDAASDVCAQLKGAGYTGCWVTAY